MPERSTGYGITITRAPDGTGWVTASLRKHMWSVGTGSRSRAVATTGFYAEGMGEQDIVSSALRELLRAYEDRLG